MVRVHPAVLSNITDLDLTKQALETDVPSLCPHLHWASGFPHSGARRCGFPWVRNVPPAACSSFQLGRDPRHVLALESRAGRYCRRCTTTHLQFNCWQIA